MRLGRIEIFIALAVTFGITGCGLDPGCTNFSQWNSDLDPRPIVDSGANRLEYHLFVLLTAAGASSTGGNALRTAASLSFDVGLAPLPSDATIARVGLSRSDGSGVVYDSHVEARRRSVVFENALDGCGQGECVREFVGWAELANVSPPAAAFDVSSQLSAPASNCGVPDRAWLDWVMVSGVRLQSTTMDAGSGSSTADGGM